MKFKLGRKGSEDMKESGSSQFNEWGQSIVRVGNSKEWIRKKKVLVE